jgi:hypothetical protein
MDKHNMSSPQLSDIIMPRVSCYLGIDPGVRGGIAYVSGHDAEAWPMPIIGNEIDVAAIRRLLLDIKPDVAIIEKALVMPRQGGVSAYTIGRNYGMLLTLLLVHQIRTEEVSPSQWKKSMGVSSDKDSSIMLASKLFPTVELVVSGRRKHHDGLAEALLLAEYGRRRMK